jgi:hypothetical protein
VTEKAQALKSIQSLRDTLFAKIFHAQNAHACTAACGDVCLIQFAAQQMDLL